MWSNENIQKKEVLYILKKQCQLNVYFFIVFYEKVTNVNESLIHVYSFCKN